MARNIADECEIICSLQVSDENETKTCKQYRIAYVRAKVAVFIEY